MTYFNIIQALVLSFLVMGTVPLLFAEELLPEKSPKEKYFHVEEEVLDDGNTIERAIIIGPPSPPPGYKQGPVVPESDQEGEYIAPSSNNSPKEKK